MIPLSVFLIILYPFVRGDEIRDRLPGAIHTAAVQRKPVNDLLRDDLMQNHPQIRIADTPPFYDLSVFNRAVETNRLLLSLECWQEVHPGLVTLPVRWDYSIPYGLLYSKNAPPDVLQPVEAVRACTGTSV